MTSQPLHERDSAELPDPQWTRPLAALQLALADATRAVAELWVSLEGTHAALVDRNDDATRFVAEPARDRFEGREPGGVQRESASPGPQPSAADETEDAKTDTRDAAAEFERREIHVPLDWTPATSTIFEPIPDGVPREQSPAPDDLSVNPEEELPPEKSESLTDFQRVWARIERRRMEQDGQVTADPALEAEEPGDDVRGLNLLPKEYVITVEDSDASVDLITIERALLTLAKMEDVTLISYAKGVPVISLRVKGELDMTALGTAVGTATGKQCEVIPQENGKIFLRLSAPANEELEA